MEVYRPGKLIFFHLRYQLIEAPVQPLADEVGAGPTRFPGATEPPAVRPNVLPEFGDVPGGGVNLRSREHSTLRWMAVSGRGLKEQMRAHLDSAMGNLMTDEQQAVIRRRIDGLSGVLATTRG